MYLKLSDGVLQIARFVAKIINNYVTFLAYLLWRQVFACLTLVILCELHARAAPLKITAISSRGTCSPWFLLLLNYGY